jgi:ADP-ribose pyrophosphatase
MNENDVEIFEKETAFQGYFRIDRYRLRHRLFAGGWSEAITREVFERGHVVGVLPYDPIEDRVVLIEQFRIGAYAAGFSPWLIEIVAGVIEAGEEPEEVARRETLEETGCSVTELMPVTSYLVGPGAASESVKLFCGRVDARGAGGIHGKKEEHEDIRVFSAPFTEAMARLDSGEIKNAVSIIALQWLALNHDRLRRRWG